MGWIRLLLISICIFIVLIGGAVIFLLTQELGQLKGPLEQFVTRQTGRQFAIDGRFDLNVGRQLSLVAGDIRLGNPEWAKADDMVRIGHAEVIVDLWSLVRGPLLIELVQVDAADVALEVNETGADNWTFREGTDKKPADDKNALPIRFILQLARIDNLRLTYVSPEQTEPLRISVESFRQRQASEDMLEAHLEGTINDKLVTVDGRYGPFTSLLSGTDLNYDIAGRFDTLSITSTGKFGSITSPRRPELELHIKGPDINHVTQMLGRSSLGAGTLDLDASVKPADGKLIASITGNLGPYTISGNGEVRDRGKLENVDAGLKVKGPNLGRVTRLFGVDGMPDDPFDMSGKVTRAGKVLNVDEVILNIGGARLRLHGTVAEFPSLNGTNLNLNVSGPDVARFRALFDLPGAAEGPFEINGEMNVSPEGKELLDVRLKTNIGEFNVSGTVTEPPAFVGTRLKYAGKGASLKPYGDAFGFTTLAADPFRVDGELEVATDQLVTRETFRLNLGANRIEVDGAIGFKPLEHGTDVRLHATGPDLAAIAQMAGLEEGIPAVAYDVDGQFTVIDSGYLITGLRAAVGDNRMEIDGTIGSKPLERGTNVRIRVTGPDLTEITQIAGVDEGVPEVAYDINAQFAITSRGYRITGLQAAIGDARITLDGTIGSADDFAGTDVTFSAHAPDFETLMEDFEVPPGPFDAAGRVRLESDELRLKEVAVHAGGADVVIDAIVGLPFKFPDEESREWGSERGDFDIDAKGPDLRAVLPKMEWFSPDASRFEIRQKGKWRGQQWTFDKVTIKIADARLNVAGKVDRLEAMSDTDLKFDVHIPSLARLGLINGRRLPDTRFELDAHFSGSPTVFEIDRIEGRFGDGDLRGRVAAKLDREVPEISVDIDSKLLDLTPFLPAETTSADGLEEEIEDVFDDQSADEPDDGRVIPDQTLILNRLREFNADVDIDAEQLRLRQSVFHNFALYADVADGHLNLKRLAGEGPAGRFDGSLTIDPVDDTAQVAATLQGSQIFLGLSEKLTEEERELAPRYDVDISIGGTGLTLRQIASTLNGRVRITSNGGRVLNSGMTFLVGDFLNEILSAINPFVKQDPYTHISCIAALADITNGQMKVDPGIIVQTDKMNIASHGLINFQTEEVDLNFKTSARKGIGISAGSLINPYIKVAGTLQDPRLTLDPKGTLITGGAAVATFGLSILATTAWDRAFQKKDPCGAAIAEADERWGK